MDLRLIQVRLLRVDFSLENWLIGSQQTNRLIVLFSRLFATYIEVTGLSNFGTLFNHNLLGLIHSLLEIIQSLLTNNSLPSTRTSSIIGSVLVYSKIHYRMHCVFLLVIKLSSPNFDILSNQVKKWVQSQRMILLINSHKILSGQIRLCNSGQFHISLLVDIVNLMSLQSTFKLPKFGCLIGNRLVNIRRLNLSIVLKVLFNQTLLDGTQILLKSS